MVWQDARSSLPEGLPSWRVWGPFAFTVREVAWDGGGSMCDLQKMWTNGNIWRGCIGRKAHHTGQQYLTITEVTKQEFDFQLPTYFLHWLKALWCSNRLSVQCKHKHANLQVYILHHTVAITEKAQQSSIVHDSINCQCTWLVGTIGSSLKPNSAMWAESPSPTHTCDLASGCPSNCMLPHHKMATFGDYSGIRELKSF